MKYLLVLAIFSFALAPHAAAAQPNYCLLQTQSAVQIDRKGEARQRLLANRLVRIRDCGAAILADGRACVIGRDGAGAVICTPVNVGDVIAQAAGSSSDARQRVMFASLLAGQGVQAVAGVPQAANIKGLIGFPTGLILRPVNLLEIPLEFDGGRVSHISITDLGTGQPVYSAPSAESWVRVPANFLAEGRTYRWHAIVGGAAFNGTFEVGTREQRDAMFAEIEAAISHLPASDPALRDAATMLILQEYDYLFDARVMAAKTDRVD